MAKVTFFFSDTLNTPANFFVMALYDNTAPSVLVEALLIPKGGGYTPPIQGTFLTNLLPQRAYTMKLWESTDSTPTGTVRNSTTFVANITNTLTRLPDYITVGITPGWVAGAASVTDTTLVNWDYTLYRNQVNMLFPEGYPNVTVPDYRQTVSGGIELITDGVTLQDGEQYVIRYEPQIANLIQQVAFIQSGQIISEETKMLDNTYLDQELYIQGNTVSVTVTLPALSTVGDYKTVNFNNRGGFSILIVRCPGADMIQDATLLSEITLIRGQDITLYKANGVWNLRGSIDRGTGEIVYSYTAIDTNKYIIADGTTYNRQQQWGLWRYINTLPPFCIVSEAAWGIQVGGVYVNKGFWTLGDGSVTFRAPLLSLYDISTIPTSMVSGTSTVKASANITGGVVPVLRGVGLYALIKS